MHIYIYSTLTKNAHLRDESSPRLLLVYIALLRKINIYNVAISLTLHSCFVAFKEYYPRF